MKHVRACDVMAKDVFGVSPDLVLLELERELAARRITGAPVLEHGVVVGCGVGVAVDLLRAAIATSQLTPTLTPTPRRATYLPTIAASSPTTTLGNP